MTLHGLDRFAARKKIVERLDASGLLVKIEPHVHAVPHGDRSGAVIEPFLTDQWYVDAKTLAEPAIAAVREGKTEFVPENWEAPSSIGWRTSSPGASRASSGGAIRFPAWYGPDGKIFVAETEDEAVSRALRAITQRQRGDHGRMQGHDIAPRS